MRKLNEDHQLQLLSQNPEVGDGKTEKKILPFEEALHVIGYGRFHWKLNAVVGFALFSCLGSTLVMSYAGPAMACDMGLTSTQQGTLTATIFVGMICSSQLFGYLGDRLGRRAVVLPCLTVSGVLQILASLTPNLITLQVIWFCNGLMVAGVVTPALVYASEYTSFPNRARVLLITSAIASLASTYDPCISWLILPLEVGVSSWRLLLGLQGVPCLVAAALLARIPESPKFLLCQGRHQQTMDILRLVHTTNKPKESFPRIEVKVDEEDEGLVAAGSVGFFRSIWTQTVLLFKPPLLLYTLLSCSLQFGIIGSYNVVMLWFPELINRMTGYLEAVPEYGMTVCQVLGSSGEADSDLPRTPACYTEINRVVFIANIFVGLLQFFAFGVTSKISDLLGRKAVMATFILLSSACSFLVTQVYTIPLTIICFGVIVVLVGAALPLSLSIVVDFFPTSVRSMAACITMIFGRIGSAGGSQIFGIFQRTHCDVAYYIIGSFLLAIGILTLTLRMKNSNM